jgi:hypothetical protein
MRFVLKMKKVLHEEAYRSYDGMQASTSYFSIVWSSAHWKGSGPYVIY